MEPSHEFRPRPTRSTGVIDGLVKLFTNEVDKKMDLMLSGLLKIWPFIAEHAPSLLSWLVSALARALLTEKTKAFFKNRGLAKAYLSALERAITAANREYAEQLPFLLKKNARQALESELKLLLSRDQAVDPTRVVAACEAPVDPRKRDALKMAVARLLELAELEIKREPALQELISHRQSEENNQILRELKRALPLRSSENVNEATAFDRRLNAEAISKAFEAASRDLLAWPQTIDGTNWIHRPEIDELLSRIADCPDSVSLLLGVPGAGKSALLARLAERARERGWLLLAIKADQLSEDVATLDGLTEFCDLPAEITECVRAAATSQKVVLIIDQLDALSELTDLRSRRLGVLLKLIARTKGIENIHIVCSCRTFERQYDRRLSGIEASEITLSLPPWEEAAKLLAAKGVVAGAWPAEFHQLLRVPQYLKLFLRHFSGPGEAQVFQSYQTMLEHLWTERLFTTAEHASASKIVRTIATQMAEHEVLFVASARFDENREDIEYLMASGVLQYDQSRKQISFTHQTIFDFAWARSFVADELSLATYVLARQSALFVRPKLWSALHYLRATNPDSYREQLTQIWSSQGLRSHLRMLLIDFVGQQADPAHFEVQLLKPVLVDVALSPRVLLAARGREQWFWAIADQELTQMMTQSAERAWPAQSFLAAAWPFARDKVIELLRKHWASDSTKREHLWYVLRSLEKWDDETLSLAMTLVTQGDIAPLHVHELASIVSASNPHLAPKLIGAHLRREVKRAIDTRAPRPEPANGNEEYDVTAHIRYTNNDPIRKLLQGSASEWYDVAAIAEAAPQEFLREVWPPIREAIERVAAEDSSRADSYQSDHLLSTHFELDEDGRREYPLVDSLVLAAKGCAKEDPVALREIVLNDSTSSSMTVHRLLAIGLCDLAPSEPAFVLEYLLSDERRLSLSNFHEDERETKMLIRSLVPHLDSGGCLKLEKAILSANPYRTFAQEQEPKQKFKFQKYTRQFRLRLLLQIPPARLSQKTRQLVDSELKIFSGFKDERREIRITSSASPMSAAEMKGASDQTLEDFIDAFPDETGWGGSAERDGGSVEVSRAFAQFAKEEPDRAAAIVEKLSPETHQRPVAYVVRDLDEKTTNDEAFFELVQRLDQKGFASSEFRDAAAHQLRSRVKASIGLPNTMIVLLERWLSEIARATPRAEVDHTLDDEDSASSETDKDIKILWGLGTVRSLPAGAYTILNAFAYGLLARDEVPSTRLIEKFREFLELPGEIATWDALAFDALSLLRRCDASQAEQFLSDLFRVYPGLLASRAGVFVVARALHWASEERTKQWMMEILSSTWSLAKVAFGELLILRAQIHKEEVWAKSEIDQYLVDTALEATRADVIAGLLHGACHMWAEEEDRELFTRVLINAMNTTNKRVATAAIDWFRLADDSQLDDQTLRILRAIADGQAIDLVGTRSSIVDFLGDAVGQAPELVYLICKRLINLHNKSLSNLASAAPLEAESLLTIALTLQRLEEPHRSRGLELFELLLSFNAYKANDVLIDIDRRPGASVSVSTIRRRRRKRRGDQAKH